MAMAGYAAPAASILALTTRSDPQEHLWRACSIQQRNQERHHKMRIERRPQRSGSKLHQSKADDINHKCEPQPVQKQPKRREQEGPEIKAVTHEQETLGSACCFAFTAWRCMHGISGHFFTLPTSPGR